MYSKVSAHAIYNRLGSTVGTDAARHRDDLEALLQTLGILLLNVYVVFMSSRSVVIFLRIRSAIISRLYRWR